MIHSEEKHGPLTIDECTIIKGALDMKNKKATSIMTPLDSVFMLHSDMKINKDTLKMVIKSSLKLIIRYTKAVILESLSIKILDNILLDYSMSNV